MKKIAFVNNQIFSPWGGSEVLWYETALRLRKEGHRIEVYFPKWPQLPKEAIVLEKAGCCVTYYPFVRNLREKLIANLPFGFLKQDPLKMRKEWLEQAKPDLLVLTDLLPRGKEWMRIASEAKVPYVMIGQLADETLWHSAEELQDSDILYAKAAKVFVLSQENKIALFKQLGKTLSNVETVYNPFQVNIHQPFSYPPLQNGKVHLACVARFGIEHKRQDILLEILADPKWRNRNIHLNLYGRGTHEQSLRNLVQYYDLDNVSFCGHVSDVNEIWEKNHALVLPSRYEGVSLAFQEALISYRVCIVTQVGGVSHMVRDNETGFVAAAATTPLFEEALERAWQRVEEWETIGQEAGKRARSLLPSDPIDYFMNNLLQLI